MIEKRLVQWYAADAGVDLDIAEREIVLCGYVKARSTSRISQNLRKGHHHLNGYSRRTAWLW